MAGNGSKGVKLISAAITSLAAVMRLKPVTM
jgi:hypothetical protein